MSWRFVLRPKWIVRHVAVAILVVTMLLLGFWQLRRLDEKRDYEALVEARQAEPAVDVATVVPAGEAVDAPAVDAVLYRNVTATGVYEDDDTVVVENRTFNGASGAWVLTPLRLADGSAVLVNRGFIGFDSEGAIVAPPAPEGEVTVDRPRAAEPGTGSLRSHGPPRVSSTSWPASTSLGWRPRSTTSCCRPTSSWSTAHPPEAAVPEGEPALVPLGTPRPSEGPHLAYAVQWFIFTTIAAGGYVLLLRRVARDQAKEEAGASADSLGGPPEGRW